MFNTNLTRIIQIIGAPSFFPTIWGYITKWFEPKLTSKISVLSTTEAKRTLTQYIDPRDLPQSYGGHLDWEYGMHPDMDKECQHIAGRLANQWVEGPLRYTCDESGDGAAITSTGTDGGGRLRHTILSRVAGSLDSSSEDLE